MGKTNKLIKRFFSCTFISIIVIIIIFFKLEKIEIQNLKGIYIIQYFKYVPKISVNAFPTQDKNEIIASQDKSIENLLKIRKRAKLENTDEFITEVLAEVKLEEVDLLTTEGRKRHSEYDEEIQKDLGKIIPGLGEGGEGVDWEHLFDNETVEDMKTALKIERVNYPLGYYISLNRSLKSTRPEQCRKLKYDKYLPSMSVVIIALNEVYILIIRTIHSIFATTPSHLLKEVILVMDFYNNTGVYSGTGNKLERYLITQFPKGKVRLIRLKSSSGGLMRARMIGAHYAIGDVILFTDSHVEFEKQWAEPLLQRIKEDPTILVQPEIWTLDEKNYTYISENYVDIFNFFWDGRFEWINKGYIWEPKKSPTMHGAVFAIDRNYFWKIGSFDPGMRIWGVENIELPFRVWMCSGSVEIIPCSRCGHIYRHFHSYNFNVIISDKNPLNNTNEIVKVDATVYNMARAAEVWLDEYKELYYQRFPIMRNNFGDVSKRIALRKRLGCKSFKWYLDNIAVDREREEFGAEEAGRFLNIKTNKCLTFLKTDDEKTLFNLENCTDTYKDSLQTFYILEDGIFRINTYFCLGSEKMKKGLGLYYSNAKECWQYNYDIQENFIYDSKNLQIRSSDSRKCLTALYSSTDTINKIIFSRCDYSSISSQFINRSWKFLNIKDYSKNKF